MFDFGDELIIDGQRIPWLLWIQLLVMLLLLIFLYYICILALGLDPSPSAAATPPSTALLASNSKSSGSRPPPTTASSNSSSRLPNWKRSQSQTLKGDVGTSTSRRVRRQDIQEKEDSPSAKEVIRASGLERSHHHPCHYLGLAKQAFLKCLGLDPATKDSSNPRQRKEQ